MTTLSPRFDPHGRASAGPVARPRALLFVLAANMLIDALEVSVVLVALPAIGGDLGLSPQDAQWMMSGFALGFAALLLSGPRITARWGRRRAYLVALLVFAVASSAGGLVHSGELLVLTRVIKGMCAALTAPTGLAIIATAYRQGDEQRRAVAVYSFFGAAGFTVGLLASGALTVLSWRWDLVLPAPIALGLMVLGFCLIPDDRGPAPTASPGTGVTRFLRHGPLVRSALCAASLNGAYLGLLLLVTYQLHTGPGWNSWQTAVALLPACVPLMVSLPFAGRMVGRLGAARLIVSGTLAATLGCAGCAVWGVSGSYATGALPALLLVEAGFVLSFAALNMQAVAGIAPESRQTAVSLYQTAVQLGAALTLPAVALLLGSGGEGPYRTALLLITAVAAVGAAVACTGTRRKAEQPCVSRR
uniref:Transporter n=1 Tax=Streptomyces fradiae TaxID=1906 RepID=Q9RPA9_STRFR|nr:transporter [Streptomyces fradiae]